jgi:hypothetical protein
MVFMLAAFFAVPQCSLPTSTRNGHIHPSAIDLDPQSAIYTDSENEQDCTLQHTGEGKSSNKSIDLPQLHRPNLSKLGCCPFTQCIERRESISRKSNVFPENARKPD